MARSKQAAPRARKSGESTSGVGRALPKGKAWGGRFAEQTDRLVEQFTSSLSFDRRLYPYDIQGSIAHCRTLERAGVFTRTEAARLVKGLQAVKRELDQGAFLFLPQDEDIHMAIERRLTEVIGPLGGKLHTGRSRNDQVALDLRLFLRDVLSRLMGQARAFQRVLVRQARAYVDVVMPGYTHLQRAQPVLLAHHFLAYVEMLDRDYGRLQDCRKRLNVMPLGSGALAGSNYPVDRRYTASLLDFPALTQNSLDAVSDRDGVVEVLGALSLIMMHLSRLSEELILWASQEFRYVDLPDSFCTGSSMMPQKKNPDVPELVRGKTGRVYGHLMGTLTLLKGLPLSYNRDLQEDKEALFDAVDTTESSLVLCTELMRRLVVNRAVLAEAAEGGGMLATELADYLVTKGVPFREAHSITGQIVRSSLERQRPLQQMTLAELRTFSTRFERDALTCLTVQGAIARKRQLGGTAGQRVEARIKELEKALA
ncbi:MAG: Argininosuccinate lyase [Nitrospirae bacterium]|nr:Argininosuccinate lyase [Nitrospirota bacterium]MCK6492930.1 argininosuccinate lyase [Nitrospira sp.]MCK6498124.1 argininosuccinate lyase [Nitrospira sp.]MEB2337975.1 argininosuccinate lyase [Nitrospirales bacterium]QOJ35059.1 MAG: argininosuccinate lyase [Nitrospira sp.]